MNILIINAHWDNRGDEAAIRSMIMELLALPNVSHIAIQRAIGEFGWFPKIPNVTVIGEFPKSGKIGKIEYLLAKKSKGKILVSKEAKEFYKALKGCDIVLHAPGGPSIGDIYYNQEVIKLRRLDLVVEMNKKLMFYAPSMGPFEKKERNNERYKILSRAKRIVLRESMSKEFLKELNLDDRAIVTLDSAFQYEFNETQYQNEYDAYVTLSSFIDKYKGKVIGMTVTDLQWNTKYTNSGVDITIKNTFERMVCKLSEEGWELSLFHNYLVTEMTDYICNHLQMIIALLWMMCMTASFSSM